MTKSVPIRRTGCIVFDDTNDAHGDARAYVARKITQGVTQPAIVRNAWLHREDLVPTTTFALSSNCRSSAAIHRPAFRPVDIYYDLADVEDAHEGEIIEALARAEQRGGSP
jgi:hypothetical protein